MCSQVCFGAGDGQQILIAEYLLLNVQLLLPDLLFDDDDFRFKTGLGPELQTRPTVPDPPRAPASNHDHVPFKGKIDWE